MPPSFQLIAEGGGLRAECLVRNQLRDTRKGRPASSKTSLSPFPLPPVRTLIPCEREKWALSLFFSSVVHLVVLSPMEDEVAAA